MGSIFRVFTVLAVAVSAALAAAWTGVVAAVTPLAAVTALVMGGTGMPLLNTGPVATPDAVTSWYLGWTKNTYITPSLRAGDSYAGSVAVYTPEEFWPLPNQQLTFDESVRIGLVNLAGCAARGACTYNTTATGASSPDGAERFLVFGYSQSARVATNLKRALIATHNAAGDWATVPALDFVLIGNPNRPNGGILERFAGLSIPFFGISFDGATPTDSDCANGCKFATADYSRQYDGYSDFPLYPLNLLADLNALAGIFTVHGNYFDVDPAGFISQGEYGDTRYWLLPTATLPILSVLQGVLPAGVNAALAPLYAGLDAPLRTIIELGYDRSISPGAPTPARLLRLSPLRDAITVGIALATGIDDAVATASGNPGLRPLGTAKTGPFGVPQFQWSDLAGETPGALGAPEPVSAAGHGQDRAAAEPPAGDPVPGDRPAERSATVLRGTAGSGLLDSRDAPERPRLRAVLARRAAAPAAGGQEPADGAAPGEAAAQPPAGPVAAITPKPRDAPKRLDAAATRDTAKTGDTAEPADGPESRADRAPRAGQERRAGAREAGANRAGVRWSHGGRAQHRPHRDVASAG